MELTKEQTKVVELPINARILVEAVPGSGKTEVLAWRISKLLESGANVGEIMVLSFSNSAVRTLTTRLKNIYAKNQVKVEDLRHISVRTFDSWVFRFLVGSGLTPKELLKQSYEDNIIKAVELIDDGQINTNFFKGIKHVFVDEVQDLSGPRAQLALSILNKVSPADNGQNGFTILGDRNQSIFGFSIKDGNGITSDQFLEKIQSNWSKSIVPLPLTKNLRQSKELQDKISSARSAFDSQKSSEILLKILEVVKQFEKVDVKKHYDGSVGIICRTNEQALRTADFLWGKEELFSADLPYLNAGDQTRRSPAWVAILFNEVTEPNILLKQQFIKIHKHVTSKSDSEIPDAEYCWSFLQRCLKTSTDSSELNLKLLRERLNWADFFPDDEMSSKPNTLEVTTIHQSKGREFDTIFIIGEPTNTEKSTENEVLEEARILYVAITRSRNTIKLSEVGVGKPLFLTDLWYGRERLFRNEFNGVRVECGLSRDINPESFIHPIFFEKSEEKVAETQQFLLENINTLVGRKVLLLKNRTDPAAPMYEIRLQEDGQPGKLLGSMSAEFTQEISSAAKKAGQWSPGRIYNLRISSVCSFASPTSELGDKCLPWSETGFWLGVGLTGLGYFKKFKK